MKCVFLTGATGVIGGELVSQLLHEDDCQIRLLIRADSPTHLRTRVNDLVAFCRYDGIVDQRLKAVTGDISDERLGLDERSFQELTSDVTHVIHCAGNVKLNQDIRTARHNAVEPAKQIIGFSRNCEQLAKVDVVSTIGVCGTMGGLIPERQLTQKREFRNNYEASKAEAEDLYYQAIHDGLPLTVHRPSMVVGHSETGRIRQFQVFYHLCEFLSGRRTLGIVVDPGETRLDLVPVNFAAASILRSNADPTAAGQTFHLCSGPEKSIRVADLTRLVRDRFQQQHGHLPRLRVLSPGLFRIAIGVGKLSGRRLRKQFAALSHFLAYLGTDQSFSVTASAIAGPCGQVCPEEYLKTIFDYYFAKAG